MDVIRLYYIKKMQIMYVYLLYDCAKQRIFALNNITLDNRNKK